MLKATTLWSSPPAGPRRAGAPIGLPSLLALIVVTAMIGMAASFGCIHGRQRNNERANRFQAEGAQAYALGQLDRAAGLFSLALEYEPRMAEARNGLGLVALARGDKATAEAQFKTALALNEELAEAHLNLGLINLDRGAMDEALARFRQALAIDPGFGAARLAVAETLLQLGRPDEARWDLVKLTEVEPRNARAQAAHARVLVQLGRVAAAEQAAQQALALDPNLPDAHRARGEILMSRGDYPGAAAEFRITLQALPMDVEVRVQLVTVLIAAAQDADVDRELDTLEQTAPTRPQVAFVRSLVALRRGELSRAIAAARRAIRLRPKYPQARMVLAEALLTTGQEREGRSELKRFLEEAPGSMEPERRLAREFLAR